MRKEHIKKMHEQAEHVFNYAEKDVGDYRESWRIFRIMAEFVEGYQFLSEVKNDVTILGSARFDEKNSYYKVARELGSILGQNGFTVITGGGPGIMEAANRGAYEAGGSSLGLNIELPFEQVLNKYVTRSASFNYFFTRKVMLTSPASAFVVFPGGYGTLDEFLEIVDLMDLGYIQKVPLVLVGKKFWQPIIEFFKKGPCKTGFLDPQVLQKWHIVDTAKQAYEFIKDCKDLPVTCDLSPNSFQCIGNVDWKIFRIMSELVEGFEFLTTIKNDITVLGTKHLQQNSPYYKVASNLGRQLGTYGYSVITGGGFGTAEAVNRGAFDAGGISIGLGLKVGEKAEINSYLTKSLLFMFPFTRKLIVTAPSKAFIFFPGGLGTFHQLLEVLTLMQTRKMVRRPIILYDRKFWQPFHEFIKKILVRDFGTIAPEDDEIYQIVDSPDSIFELIESEK